MVVCCLFTAPVSAQAPLLPGLLPLDTGSAPRVEPLARLGRGVARAADLSPDGRLLAVATSIGVWLEAANVPDASPRLLEGQTGASSVAFDPGGALLASGGDDSSVVLWEVSSGDERARLTNHLYRVMALAFSIDGQTLASADASGVARLWDVTAGGERAALPGSASPWALAFSPDGATLAMSSRAAVEVWDTATGAALARLDLPPDAETAPARIAYADAATIAVALNGQAVAWRWGEGGPPAALEDGVAFDVGREQPPLLDDYSRPLLRVIPGAGRVTAIDTGGAATIWDIMTGEPVAGFTSWASGQPAPAAALSPDGRRIARGGNDGVARIYDATSGALLVSFHGHLRAVTSVAFSPDGVLLATGSLDGSARLWNAATGDPLAVLQGHTSGVTSIAFSPDGRLLFTASYDGTARLWGVPDA